jgi:hypothetical protein
MMCRGKYAVTCMKMCGARKEMGNKRRSFETVAVDLHREIATVTAISHETWMLRNRTSALFECAIEDP